jgi:hypothetical protein
MELQIPDQVIAGVFVHFVENLVFVQLQVRLLAKI